MSVGTERVDDQSVSRTCRRAHKVVHELNCQLPPSKMLVRRLQLIHIGVWVGHRWLAHVAPFVWLDLRQPMATVLTRSQTTICGGARTGIICDGAECVGRGIPPRPPEVLPRPGWPGMPKAPSLWTLDWGLMWLALRVKRRPPRTMNLGKLCLRTP